MLKKRMWNLAEVLRCFLFLVVMDSCSQAIHRFPRQMDSLSNSDHSSQNLISNATEQLYSPWTQWSKCSRECDVGISTRTRKCLKRTYNSRGVLVPTCRGESIEHKICKLKTCSPDNPDFRSTQCTEYNNRNIAGKLVKLWIPAEKVGPNPCELRCVSPEHSFEYSFGKVVDGTPCSLGVCLDGRCLRAGCDQHLGSEVKPDMCGVCGGHNATCVHYKDLYLGQPSADDDLKSTYHEVVVIPVGARHLLIRQVIGKNYLALQDRTTGVVFHGEQYLSSVRGKYDIAGTLVDFLKLDNSTEALVAKQPITQELYVLALLRSRNPGIYYEYWLPKETNNPYRFYLPQTANPKTHEVILPPPTQKIQSYTTPQPKPKPTRAHPTKPPFAYPYGEKPYKTEDVPVFRHRPTTTTTTASPFRRRYDPNSKRHFYPDQAVSDGPVVAGKSQKEAIEPNSVDQNPLLRNDLMPVYRKRYLTRKPLHGYYQTFRNHSVIESHPVKVLAAKGGPDLTQGDSSSIFNGRYGNSISNVVFDYNVKKHEKFPDFDKSKVLDPKWKYTVDNKDGDQLNVDSSESSLQQATPLSIAVLPLSETTNTTKPKREGKKDDRKQKSRLTRGGLCEPCQRIRNQAKQFCKSDFVIRASVIAFEFLHGETRYELEVKQSFKNNLSLLPREYVWAPDTCRCPKLRPWGC